MSGLPQKKSRGEALQAAFFHRMDQDLIESLRRRMSRESKMDAFRAVTGIRNERILESLVDAGFELPTLTAFTWAPIIFVAWADGHADYSEKSTVFDALLAKGISHDAATSMIEHDWFSREPDERLWEIWEEFSAAWLADLDVKHLDLLFAEIIDNCYAVARASGGFLGVGKISQRETDVIGRVSRQHTALEQCLS